MDKLRKLFIFAYLASSTAAHFASHIVKDFQERRHVGNFKYEPIAINPLVCTYLSDEQCQVEDEKFRDQSPVTDRILHPLHTGRSYDLLSNDVDTSVLGVVPQSRQEEPATFNLLVLLLQFKGHEDRTLVPLAEIEAMLNGKGIGDSYPGGSVSNWTESNSYGKFQLRATVVDYKLSDFTEQEIANGNSALPTGGDGPQFHDAIIPILEELDDEGFDFSVFDKDGNFRIDSILVLHSGYAAEAGDVDDDGTPSVDRIQSFASSGSGFRSRSGYAMANYARASIYRGVQNENRNTIGVMTHEFIHTLGLPDVYDMDFPDEGIFTGSVGGIAGYDIMASPFGQNGRGATPGHLSPWSKQFLGWADPVEITADGVYTLRASELYNDYFIISEPYAPGEYLMIENRQPLLFDADFYGGGGICIYKIDENTDVFGNRNRGGTFQDDWPGNGKHYKVALLQADGLYELEQGINNGNEGDLWRSGMVLGPGNGELAHSSEGTYPNSDGYSNGTIVVTGLMIDEFTEVEDGVWTFRVSGLGPGDNSTMVPSATPSAMPSVSNSPSTSIAPSMSPSVSFEPTLSAQPSSMPSISAAPSLRPSGHPTVSEMPSMIPSEVPSLKPSTMPSSIPSSEPSLSPSEESEAPTSASPTTKLAARFMVAVALLLISVQ